MKKLLFITLFLWNAHLQVNAQRGYVREAIRDKQYKEHGADGESKLNNWLGKVADVQVARSYKFPMYMQMHSITYGKNGKVKDEMDIHMYANAPGSSFGMMTYTEKKSVKKEDMFHIYDYKNNASMIFNMKDQTYMAFNLNAFMSKENQAKRESGDVKVKADIDCKKTGRTKEIQGYKCAEFVCEQTERGEKHEYWVTTQLPATLSESLARTRRQRFTGNTNGMNGAILEQYDYRDGELVSEMKVTALDPKKDFVFNTEAYKYNGVGQVHFKD